MPDISATEAARSFSNVLDNVEHGKETYETSWLDPHGVQDDEELHTGLR